MKTIRRVKLFLLLLILGVALYTQRVFISDWVQKKLQPTLPAPVSYEQTKPRESDVVPPATKQQNQKAPEAPVTTSPVAMTIPDNQVVFPPSLNLAVPFTSQAPKGNWDPLHEEACEEASVYMVDQYYAGLKQPVIDSDIAEKEIQKMVAFEKETFGFFEDTTAEQTGTFAELLYGRTYTLIENPTVNQIKEQLVAGHPVIVPAAGQLLGNPNFHVPGPVYHMVVIRGYTEKNQFITNDSGTRNGEAYLYSFDTVLNAMHDWNNGKEITDGRKVVIVLSQ